MPLPLRLPAAVSYQQRAAATPARCPALQRLKQLSTQRLVQRLHSPNSSTSSEPLDGYTPSPAARPVRQLQQPAKGQPEWLDEDPFAAPQQQKPGPSRTRPAANTNTSSKPQWQDPDMSEDDSPAQPPAARGRAQPPAAASKKPVPAASQWRDEQPPYQPPARAAPRQAPSPAPAPASAFSSGSGFAGRSQQPAVMPDESAGADLPKVQCTSCGRSFIETAYERHAKICEKVFVQKRKAYDMSARRAEGLEAPPGGGAVGGRGGRTGAAGGGRKAAAAPGRK
jgi:hypothetical protein